MNDTMIRRLLAEIPPEASIREIAIYHHWIVAQSIRFGFSCYIPGAASCGLRADAGRESDMNGWIGRRVGESIDQLLRRDDALSRSTGIALLNSALPVPEALFDGDSQHFYEAAAGTRKSCFIGHFKDAEAWRDRGAPVTIIELNPQPGDVHWDAADDVLRECEMVFITGLTLINDTFEKVIERTPNAKERILFGPTVPLSPIWFDYGITTIGSTLITNPAKVMTYFQRGGTTTARAPENSVQKVNLRAPGLSQL